MNVVHNMLRPQNQKYKKITIKDHKIFTPLDPIKQT